VEATPIVERYHHAKTVKAAKAQNPQECSLKGLLPSAASAEETRLKVKHVNHVGWQDDSSNLS